MIGVPESDIDQVCAWCKHWDALLFAKLPPDQQVECARSAVAYIQFMKDLLKQRQARPQKDLTSELITASMQGKNQITQEELLELLLDLVFGGSETTGALIANSLIHLLSDRTLWPSLGSDRSLAEQVVEESMRIAGPALGFFRITTEPVNFHGVLLPKGSRLFLSTRSANYDETQFPQGRAFCPQRTKSQHLGFGYGIHYCLGAPLARLIACVALEEMSRRLPTLYLQPGQQLSYKRSVLMHSLIQLIVEYDAQNVEM